MRISINNTPKSKLIRRKKRPWWKGMKWTTVDGGGIESGFEANDVGSRGGICDGDGGSRSGDFYSGCSQHLQWLWWWE
ncbi:hypothetical protein Tco_0854451 [Tanacetum coccineum]